MAVPIENPADCDVRDIIRFQQVDEILGKLSCGIVLLHDNARQHTSRQTQDLLREQLIPLGDLRASSLQSRPGTVGLFPVSKNE